MRSRPWTHGQKAIISLSGNPPQLYARIKEMSENNSQEQDFDTDDFE